MSRIASFHLITERRARALLGLAHLGLDRPVLGRTAGLVFWRLLGTGRGDGTGPGADLRRTAMFGVWESEHHLDAFLERSGVARRWDGASESWHVRLRSAGGHGRWRGIDPLDGLEPGSTRGPIAMITRADVRLASWRQFRSAAREVDAELHQAEGLIDVVGIGEAPVGRLATFSLWESVDAVRTFAYSMPRHQQVIDETRAGDWYSEELFARFEPYGSSGTWGGRDPLAHP